MTCLPRRRHILTALAAALVLVAGAVPALADPTPTPPPGGSGRRAGLPTSGPESTSSRPGSTDARQKRATKAQYDRASARARESGDKKVRVIVGLRAAFVPEGYLTADEVSTQRAAFDEERRGILRSLAGHEHKQRREFAQIPFVSLLLSEGAVRALERSGRAASITPDGEVQPGLDGSAKVTQSDRMWDSGYTGAGKQVAIIDTGVDTSHPDFAGRISYETCFNEGATSADGGDCPNGQDFMQGTGAGVPCVGPSSCDHGTHVAGIAAGENATYRGVAPDAGIISIRVFGTSTSNSSNLSSWDSDIIAGYNWVKVMYDAGWTDIAAANGSIWGGQYFNTCDTTDAMTQAYKAAFDNLISVNIAPVTISGNGSSTNSTGAPGCVTTGITVGNTTDADLVSDSSSMASWVDLNAPGTDVMAAVPGGGHANKTGTSMAAPQVAGAWALLREKYPTESVSSILSRLTSTGKLVADQRAGGTQTKPRINIWNAAGYTTDNDNLRNRTVVSQVPYATAQYTTTASLQPNEPVPSCQSGFGKSVWYRYTPTSNARVTVTTDGSTDFDTVLAAYRSPTFYFSDFQAEVACSDDIGAARTSSITFDAVAGTPYFFQVGGWNGASGVLQINLNVTTLRTLTVSRTGEGSVFSTPSGISCPGDCTEKMLEGSTLTLNAQSPAGWQFSGWGVSDCPGTGSCTLTARGADMSINPTFTRVSRQLTVVRTGDGTVTSSPAGISCGTDCSEPFASGTSVTLSAATPSGWRFSGWGITECPGTGSCSLTMSSSNDLEVRPTFTRITRTVTVSKTGSGAVTSSPTGINCGADCSEPYQQGSQVVLSATPATGWSFTGWGVTDCPGTGSCTLTVGQNDVTLNAVFTAAAPNLRVTALAPPPSTAMRGGSFTVSDTTENVGASSAASSQTRYLLSTDYTASSGDALVATRAVPALSAGQVSPGSATATVPGDLPAGTYQLIACADAQSSVTESSETDNCRAESGPISITDPAVLNVAVGGSGSGLVTSSPAGISCPGDCTQAFAPGTSVTLSATPTTGSTTGPWSSASCGSSTTCVVTVEGDTFVGAAFDGPPPTAPTSVRATALDQAATVSWTAADGQGRPVTGYTVTSAPGSSTCSTTTALTCRLLGLNNGTAYTFTVTASSHSGTSPASTPTSPITPNPRMSVGDVAVTEGDSGLVTVTVPVRLTAPSTQAITANFATSVGTASASDFRAASGVVSIPAGTASRAISIIVNADSLDEVNENFSLTLSSPAGAVLSDATAAISIIDNDAPPQMRISDVRIWEGNTGSATAYFTVRLSAPATGELSVDYTTSSTSATSNADFTAKTGTLLFTPGQVSKSAPITVRADTLDEPNETFSITIGGLSGAATLADATGLATILDDDPTSTSSTPNLRIGDLALPEGNSGSTSGTLSVRLSAPSSAAVTAEYALVGGTAADTDFTARSGTITISAGATTAAIPVSVIGDTLDEAAESFTATLSTPSGATLGDATGVVTVIDDDAAPRLAISDVGFSEGNSGTGSALFTIRLSAPATSDVTVTYGTVDGTATAGGDYTGKTGTVTFTPGQVSKSISISTKADTLVEANETFTVGLTSPVGATSSDASGTATLRNDD